MSLALPYLNLGMFLVITRNFPLFRFGFRVMPIGKRTFRSMEPVHSALRSISGMNRHLFNSMVFVKIYLPHKPDILPYCSVVCALVQLCTIGSALSVTYSVKIRICLILLGQCANTE